MLYQLGVETQETRKPELLHMLNDLFFRNYQAGRDSVVIVDEAQLIEDDAVFEGFGSCMNFQTDDRFLVTLLLIGSPELGVKVRRLKHLDQRISLRYHLNTLDDNAHRELHRASAADGRSAESALHRGGDQARLRLHAGHPREINNLCDVALLVGYSSASRRSGKRSSPR